MKKVILITLIVAFVSCHFKQESSDPAIETLPSFTLLLADSSTKFDTKWVKPGRPTLIVYFSPECEHCHAFTKSLVKDIDSLRKIQIYMLTAAPFWEFKMFYNQYKLDGFKNITAGTDYNFSFFSIYKPPLIPYMVIYDENKKLIKTYTGQIELKTIVQDIQNVNAPSFLSDNH